MPIETLVPPGKFLLYETEDGRVRVDCWLVADTLWLPQSETAEIFQTIKQKIEKSLLAAHHGRQRATRLLEVIALAYLEGIGHG